MLASKAKLLARHPGYLLDDLNGSVKSYGSSRHPCFYVSSSKKKKKKANSMPEKSTAAEDAVFHRGDFNHCNSVLGGEGALKKHRVAVRNWKWNSHKCPTHRLKAGPRKV